jgi:hypothetical protein
MRVGGRFKRRRSELAETSAEPRLATEPVRLGLLCRRQWKSRPRPLAGTWRLGLAQRTWHDLKWVFYPNSSWRQQVLAHPCWPLVAIAISAKEAPGRG